LTGKPKGRSMSANDAKHAKAKAKAKARNKRAQNGSGHPGTGSPSSKNNFSIFNKK